MLAQAATERKDVALITIKKAAQAVTFVRVCCALTAAANASAVTLFPVVKEI